MPLPITSDSLLKIRADSLRAVLNGGHLLRLFSNPVNVAPNTPRSAYVENSFPGYSPYDPSFKWGPIFRAQIGEWAFELPLVTWTPTGASGQKCYGWFMTFGSRVSFAQRFAAALECDLLQPIPLVLRISDRSLSLCSS